MSIKDFCNMNVICCESDTSVAAVAALMRHHHVGDVVVVEKNAEGLRIPVGIVTDRDILVESISLDIEARLFTAGDMMTAPLITVQEDASLFDAIKLMRDKKIRRLPVLAQAGTLFGIITADDVINLLASELSLMAAAMVEQPGREQSLRK
jgi:CBS domain-containing protein